MISTYFKPLRRKFGIVTLLIACVFVLGWIRSMVVADTLRVQPDSRSAIVFMSTDRHVALWLIQFIMAQGEIPEKPTYPEWSAKPFRNFDAVLPRRETSQIRRFHEFGSFTDQFDGLDIRILFAPYWSIVIPLTLLSALLLLSKHCLPTKIEQSQEPEA